MFEFIKKIFTPLPPPTPEELEEVRKKFKLQLDMRRGMIPMEDYEKELKRKIAEMSSMIHTAKTRGLRQDLRLEIALKVFQEELENLASKGLAQSPAAPASSVSQANFEGYDEPKIFGPLTLKQFVYLFGGAGIIFLLHAHAQFSPLLTFVLGFPVAIVSFMLAFYRRSG